MRLWAVILLSSLLWYVPEELTCKRFKSSPKCPKGSFWLGWHISRIIFRKVTFLLYLNSLTYTFKELLQLEIDNGTLERGSITNQEKIKLKPGNKTSFLKLTHLIPHQRSPGLLSPPSFPCLWLYLLPGIWGAFPFPGRDPVHTLRMPELRTSRKCSA